MVCTPQLLIRHGAVFGVRLFQEGVAELRHHQAVGCGDIGEVGREPMLDNQGATDLGVIVVLGAVLFEPDSALVADRGDKDERAVGFEAQVGLVLQG